MEKLTNKEKAIFASELETVLSSGMNVLEGLELIAENQSGRIADAAKFIKGKIDYNISLTGALKDCDLFDNYFRVMVEVGELNGKLDVVCRELKLYYEREDKLERKVREAITYPIVLMWMMCALMAVLLFKILPIFENVMKKMGLSFNGVSALLNRFSRVLLIFCFAALAIVSLLSIIYFIYIKISGNTSINSRILEKFPLSRKLYETSSIARFTYALSLFVSSGYPLESAVSYLSGLGDDHLNAKIEEIKKGIDGGNTFVDEVIRQKIYSGKAGGIFSIGMKAGRDEETFKQLTAIYEEEVEEKTDKFLNIIEPVIVAILSFVIGVVLVSIMLPLVGIMGSLA